MKIKYSIFSEQGRRRSNEDVCRHVAFPDGSALFVVCDGMGGHYLGDVAARIVSDTVCEVWDAQKTGDENVAVSVAAATEKLSAYSKTEMGTTLVLAYIKGNRVTIANIGDSRCYLLGAGELLFLTRDHVNDSGFLTNCFMSSHPEAADPTVLEFTLVPEDRIFLCTDGVYKSMSPDILTARLQDDKPLDEVIDVIKFLCEKYSDDNYSGILIEIN